MLLAYLKHTKRNTKIIYERIFELSITINNTNNNNNNNNNNTTNKYVSYIKHVYFYFLFLFFHHISSIPLCI